MSLSDIAIENSRTLGRRGSIFTGDLLQIVVVKILLLALLSSRTNIFFHFERIFMKFSGL